MTPEELKRLQEAQAKTAGQMNMQTQQTQQIAPATSMQGVSQQTHQQLQRLSQGYRPSQAVNQAHMQLQQTLTNRPGAYVNPHQAQLNTLYQQVMNRPQFKYDLNGDMLYQQYRDQYQQAGRQAMMDTMGQAAAMTGGYGNSYAATAGNQAYQQYLAQLNNVIPSLQDRAYQRYQDEGAALNNQYALTQAAEQADYGRYQDSLNRWQADRDYAQGAYQSEYNRDYQQHQAMLDYYARLAAQENQDYYNAIQLQWQAEDRAAAAAAGGGGRGRGGRRRTAAGDDMVDISEFESIMRAGQRGIKSQRDMVTFARQTANKMAESGQLTPEQAALIKKKWLDRKK